MGKDQSKHESMTNADKESLSGNPIQQMKKAGRKKIGDLIRKEKAWENTSHS